MHEKAKEIMEFWFGDTTEFRQEWFQKNPEFDEKIRQKFGEDLEAAIRGEYDDWAKTPEGRMALIILLDQFSRNLFRGSPRSFGQDDKALELTLEGIELGHDLKVPPIQRTFFYLPLEHSEELEMQNLALKKYGELLEAQGEEDYVAKQSLEYARRHHVIIERFGRFPHRNEVLGRESTPEELHFLTQPNSSF